MTMVSFWLFFRIVGMCSLASLVLSGCVSSSVMPVANDAVIISTRAAPACGRQGAQRMAVAEAAAETLRRGYDAFVIVGAESTNNVGVVGHMPVRSTTDISGDSLGSFGPGGSYQGTFSATAETRYSGGEPIIAGTHDQDIAIRMFKAGASGSENAIDARATLGAQWQEAMANPSATCF